MAGDDGDLREFAFWLKQSRIVQIDRHVEQIQAVRIGQSEAYSEVMTRLNGERRKLLIGPDAFYREQWSDLRALSKRNDRSVLLNKRKKRNKRKKKKP